MLSRQGPSASFGYDPTPYADGPLEGSARAYACRRRHYLAHLCTERCPQYGSCQLRGPGWLVTSSQWCWLVTSSLVVESQQACPAHSAATCQRLDRLGRGSGLPIQAYLRTVTRKKERTWRTSAWANLIFPSDRPDFSLINFKAIFEGLGRRV